jgi:hypothetical protein
MEWFFENSIKNIKKSDFVGVQEVGRDKDGTEPKDLWKWECVSRLRNRVIEKSHNPY